MTAPRDVRGTVADLARRRLGFETLETRGRDSLDFRECSAESVRGALSEAFDAGRAAQRAADDAAFAASLARVRAAVSAVQEANDRLLRHLDTRAETLRGIIARGERRGKGGTS